MRSIGLAIFALFASSAVAAQEGVVFGQVVDSVSAQPLGGVSTYFTTNRLEYHTGADGLFTLHGDLTRDSVLVVRRIGYVPRTFVVSELAKLPLLDVGIVYLRPVATMLDKIAVVTEEVRRFPQLVGFYDRKEKMGGLGHFFTRENIERTAASRTSDVLRQSHKVELECNRSSPSGSCAPASRRAREVRFRLRAADSTYSVEELGPLLQAEGGRCRMDVWV